MTNQKYFKSHFF